MCKFSIAVNDPADFGEIISYRDNNVLGIKFANFKDGHSCDSAIKDKRYLNSGYYINFDKIILCDDIPEINIFKIDDIVICIDENLKNIKRGEIGIIEDIEMYPFLGIRFERFNNSKTYYTLSTVVKILKI